MVEEQDPSQPRLSAAFPAPPPFWKLFTSENLDKLEEHKNRYNADLAPSKWIPTKLHALDLPPELRLLIPPGPPSGTYTCFGQELDISGALPPLSSKGTPQLFPATLTGSTHAFALHKLLKSILLNFVEYVDILANSPAYFEPKLQDIQTLFINAHQLINMYRPHQARETLILRMEREIEEGKREIKEMRGCMGKMGTYLREVESEGREVGGGRERNGMNGEKAAREEAERRAGKRIWGKLDVEHDED